MRGVQRFRVSAGSSLSRLAVMAFPDARAIAVDDGGLDSAVTLLAERPGP